MTENLDSDGNKLSDCYLPMSLRVEDSSVEKSNDGEIVDFIFSKDSSNGIYNKLMFKDEEKKVPDYLKALISRELLEIGI